MPIASRDPAAPPPVCTRPVARLLLFAIALHTAAGCTDLREYTGTWTGSIVTNPQLRLGFTADTTITVEVEEIDRGRLVGTMTVGPAQDATAGFTAAPLVPVERATNDELGDLTFEGDPLATYLFWALPDDPAEEHAMVIISAHEDNQLHVRILRSDLYGVFRLKRR